MEKIPHMIWAYQTFSIWQTSKLINCSYINGMGAGYKGHANIWGMEEVGEECETNDFYRKRGSGLSGRSRCLITGAKSTHSCLESQYELSKISHIVKQLFWGDEC